MRTFIAIELPPDVKNALAVLQNELKTSAADVKWVEPENIHLTLKFLGERDEKKVKEFMRILDEICPEENAFCASLSCVGAFPDLHSARVIWAGVDEGAARIAEIARELEEAIAKIGIPKDDRPFSSHITLGRTRSASNRDRLAEKIKNIGIDYFGRKEFKFKLHNVTLFKSTLTPRGPHYEALKTASLKTA